MKKNIEINLKSLWAIGGILLGGILGVIAFEAIGFHLQANGFSQVVKLHNLLDISNSQQNSTLCGLAVSGLVFAWLSLIFPLVNLFMNNDKGQRYLTWLTIAFLVLGLILMIAAEAYFADKDQPFFDKGAVAGQFIVIIIGSAIAGAGTYLTYFHQTKSK